MESGTSFSKPVYSKIKSASGNLDPCYTFPVKTDFYIASLFDSKEFKTIQDLHVSLIMSNRDQLVKFIEQFLSFATSYFAKPYTTEIILKHLNHKLSLLEKSKNSTDGDESGQEASFTPLEVIIFQGKFLINWGLTFRPIRIEIPDLDEEESKGVVQEPKGSTEGQNLIVVDDIPIDESTEGELISLKDASRHYEKHRVKEAQLKARLAAYKAERVLSSYLNKYGADVSDSDWESSDEEESETDSD